MDNPEKKKILIVDDQKENIKLLIELLRNVYTVFFATDGIKGYELAKVNQPDLILLDIMMKPLDGYEICEMIRKNIFTKDIPVLFMTGKTDNDSIISGLESGGTDFIFKPISPTILLKRIQNYIKLVESLNDCEKIKKMSLDFNPLTLLPGINSIKTHITQLINGKKKQTVIYINIDRFKPFNEVYGYLNGDKVIVELASLLHKIANEMGIKEIFIGHYDGDIFYVSVHNDLAEDYIQRVIQVFDEKIQASYNPTDLQRGFMKRKSRQGETIEIPLMALSISGINLEKTHYSNYYQVYDACNDINKKIKQTEKSNYLMDKRVNLI